MQPAALGVNIIMTSGSEMLNKGAGLSSDIYLNAVDSAVAHIRDREIDHTVSSKE